MVLSNLCCTQIFYLLKIKHCSATTTNSSFCWFCSGRRGYSGRGNLTIKSGLVEFSPLYAFLSTTHLDRSRRDFLFGPLLTPTGSYPKPTLLPAGFQTPLVSHLSGVSWTVPPFHLLLFFHELLGLIWDTFSIFFYY